MTTGLAPDPWALAPHGALRKPRGPVCLLVMDGVGIGPPDAANAWHLAHTPRLDRLMDGPVVGHLAAHGFAVGMPSDDDMGNSEVGHNAMGAGRIFDQGAKLVSQAVDDGSLFEGGAWRQVMGACAAGGTLHLMGLWSDGNVHSHVRHVYAMLDRAASEGAHRIRLHLLLDGRDVGETSALDYVEPLERHLDQLRGAGVDARVASGGGRMITTMDRYEADWSVVERGWRTHVLGDAPGYGSITEAILSARGAKPGIIDQNLPPFVIDEGSGPVGPIVDGDAVVYFNFRGDRALEITRAFETPPEADFPFARERVPQALYAGMMQYDGDLALPTRYLVEPPAIERTMGEYLARQGIRQLALSETQKFGHVTYFFNGNRTDPFDDELERYVQIPSDRVDFAEKPRMKAAEIARATLQHMDDFAPAFARVNIANGDMVGHTGNLAAAMEAMEATDQAVATLVEGVLARGGICIVTADHGNCEHMAERDKQTGALKPGRSPEGFKPATSHTLSPVPCIVIGDGDGTRYVWNDEIQAPGLANLSATCLNLLGFEAPSDYLPGLVKPG